MMDREWSIVIKIDAGCAVLRIAIASRSLTRRQSGNGSSAISLAIPATIVVM
jgi:hypothetical protein